MRINVGLDVGGSTTKIVGMDNENIIYKSITSAGDPVTSAYGALGKLINDFNIPVTDIARINITGVGSGFSVQPMLGIDTLVIEEFISTGLGGLYLAKLDRAVVVSMGTGTAYLKAEYPNVKHIIGSGVGGGTLVGLSNSLVGIDDPEKLSLLAVNGDIGKVDLTIGDISQAEIPGLGKHITASNFGKAADDLTGEDKLCGVFNLVYQSIGTMAVLAARTVGIKDVVFTGQLTTFSQCDKTFEMFRELYEANFIIPEDAEFATAIGACLAGGKHL
ncbi:MAG: pantothenate kinase [Clostridiales bacterium]|jgi:type II pantothenate kinase|nr:pantothenate kinase [Clostridiales bacterium]MBR4494751.1 pantothenate kinase [Clostridiales bacterium]